MKISFEVMLMKKRKYRKYVQVFCIASSYKTLATCILSIYICKNIDVSLIVIPSLCTRFTVNYQYHYKYNYFYR